MKVFISWSGTQSKAVAKALREFIPDVIQAVKPWMSEVDIRAGDRWSAELSRELQETKFGIICVTPTNSNAPWLLFEAGALAKTVNKTYVCPYTIGMEPANIPSGPLSNFQAKRANKEETMQMVTAINGAMEGQGLPEAQLGRAFNRCWPELEKKIGSLPPEETSQEERRSTDEMVVEILEIVREVAIDRERTYQAFRELQQNLNYESNRWKDLGFNYIASPREGLGDGEGGNVLTRGLVVPPGIKPPVPGSKYKRRP